MAVTASPFPGVDPYLQQRWSNIHATLVPLIQEALQPTLPPGLRARVGERVLLEDERGEPLDQWYRPDVAVLSVPPTTVTAPRAGVTAGPDADVVEVEIPTEPQVERWVQIIDIRAGNRVVSAIEVLSPSNKQAGPLNRMYRAKLRDYARGG